MTDRSFGAGAAAQSRTLQKERPTSKTVDIIVDDVACRIQAILRHRKSGNISDAKEVLNVQNKDIVCIVRNAVHNRLMEIQPKIKILNVLISLEIA